MKDELTFPGDSHFTVVELNSNWKNFLQFTQLKAFCLNFQFGIRYFDSSKAINNQDIIPEFNVAFFNDSDGISRMNMTFVMKANITFYTILFGVKVVTSKNEEGIEVVNKLVNVCKMSKKFFGNFLLAYMEDALENYSNYSITCPLRAGFYHATNMPVINDKFIPTRLFLGDSHFVLVGFPRKNPQNEVNRWFFIIEGQSCVNRLKSNQKQADGAFSNKSNLRRIQTEKLSRESEDQQLFD